MDKLDLHPRIMKALKKSKINTLSVVLGLSGPDLARTTDLSARDVQLLQKSVADCVPRLPAVTVLQLYKNNGPPSLVVKKLSMGCHLLDKALKGGIISRGITEISGESASGKTQFCLQLSLTVQLPEENGGLAGETAYICTEDAFPNKRLYQMIESKQMSGVLKGLWKDGSQPGDHIYVEHIADVEGLIGYLQRKLPALMKKAKVRLVVVDSIAALFRCEYSAHESVARAKQLSIIARELHQLYTKHNIPVICVNQVTASMKKTSTLKTENVPALGLSWANHVTTRILLSRTNQIAPPETLSVPTEQSATSHMLRYLEVKFAPHLPMMTLPYCVNNSGVQGLRCQL